MNDDLDVLNVELVVRHCRAPLLLEVGVDDLSDNFLFGLGCSHEFELDIIYG